MNILEKKTGDAPAEAIDTGALTPADYRLPLWFFGFEGVLAAAFDILKAFPTVWPVLLVLLAVNIVVSLTMMRRRIKLAKALWRGKETRKLAFALIALRVGSHFALNAVGLAVTSTLGHVLFALVMSAMTIGVLAYSQETAVRALSQSAP
ncbi:hypothetical protein K7B10_13200 [Streptomyces flavotricini]|uniref:Uncharacterized protein n=1 Tax=Streptomyces flavotricini TaxID=66888 RepID=A0ABS8E409_9ACTN|nr:hypothetical protein [Streptomyces flavotricini]MCC0095715.1 hypothetical protein [Streptomyces flavotricini]